MNKKLLLILYVFFFNAAFALFTTANEMLPFVKTDIKNISNPVIANNQCLSTINVSSIYVDDNSGIPTCFYPNQLNSDFLFSKKEGNIEVKGVHTCNTFTKGEPSQDSDIIHSFSEESDKTTNSIYSSDTYTVSVSATPAEGGSLSGSGTYNYGNMVTLNATPRNGYTFTSWTENGVIVSTISTYTFSINSNRSLVARFTPFTFNILISATPSEGGTLSGGGIYDFGSTATVNATPRAGYIFVNWIENGIPVSTNSIFSFNVSGSRTLFANFISNSFSGIILATAIPTAGGTAHGGRTYEYGSVATLTATPYSGYSFSNWTENGTIVSTSPEFSFTVGGNRNLHANFTIISHSVSVTSSPADGGTASGSGIYNYGSVVNLNATPNNGYSFVRWTENGSQVSTSSTYSFSIYSNRSLVANFAPSSLFTVLSYTLPSAGGVVSGGGTYVYGSHVTLEANAGTGYSFINWTENGNQVSTSASYSFTINSDRTVIANFVPLPYSILVNALPTAAGSVSGGGTYDFGSVATLAATTNAGYTFTNWTVGGTIVSSSSNYSFMVDGSRTLTANFALNSNTIAVVASPAEGGSVSGGGTYNYGNAVTLKAIPASGYNFVNWSENGTQLNASSTYSFIITNNRTIVANFTLNPDTYSISASAIPLAGGEISGSGAYLYGSAITLTATPSTGYNFTNWTEDGTIVNENPTYSFTVTKSRKLNSNFSIKTFSSTATAVPFHGGSVSGSGLYNYGSSVVLKANPGVGYRFINWTENGAVISTNSTYSFTITTNRTLVANFNLNPGTASIMASAAPSNYGTVTGSNTYAYGSVATLTAVPNPGYSFSNWTENGTIASANPTLSFTVEESRTLTANFTLITHTISSTTSPLAGGIVNGSGTYNYGSAVMLNAIPGTGYRFVNWTENGTEVSNNSTYYFIIDSNRNLVANFTLNNFSIHISALPSEGGVVSGGGTFDYGSVATLSVKANEGYSFTGWIESGSSVSQDSTYSFIVTGSRTLLANFVLRTQTISVTSSPAEGGTVSGGGTYAYGSVLTLYTIPMNGYRFANWSENGSEVSASSTYSFKINTDRTLIANYTRVTFNISVLSLPLAGGTVSGGKTYEYGSSATLTAKANKGYNFTSWSENGTILSKDSVYSFFVEKSRTITANYSYNFQTVSAVASPDEGGFISGGGTYNYGSIVTLNATPNIGYNFINWTENGTQLSTSSVFSFSIDSDRALVANFSHNTSNTGIILASVSPAAGGTVSGSKSYDFGTTATVTAIANKGYSFSSWTEGGTVVSTDSIYSFTVERSRNLIAVFIINTYNISITASTADGGFFSGGGTYTYGSTAFLNATPYIGYSFVNWTENGENLSSNSSYSFAVGNNRDLVANFISLVGLEHNSLKKTYMYPNPVYDILFFIFPNDKQNVVSIFDNSGQIILTSYEKEINISHLAKGTYVVKVNEQVLKLVKL